VSEPGPDNEPRDGYEGWLDELAGERVKTLPIFLVWVLLVGVGCGLAYLLGARSDGPFNTVLAVISVPYWLWAVPRYARRRRARK